MSKKKVRNLVYMYRFISYYRQIIGNRDLDLVMYYLHQDHRMMNIALLIGEIELSKRDNTAKLLNAFLDTILERVDYYETR